MYPAISALAVPGTLFMENRSKWRWLTSAWRSATFGRFAYIQGIGNQPLYRRHLTEISPLKCDEPMAARVNAARHLTYVETSFCTTQLEDRGAANKRSSEKFLTINERMTTLQIMISEKRTLQNKELQYFINSAIVRANLYTTPH
jgi:hypothetical protein